MIIIVGRGHSGTRVASNLFYSNGYFTGKLNKSYDMIPPEVMYDAVKHFSRNVELIGRLQWNFNVGQPTQVFKQLVRKYLKPIIQSDSKYKYFKLPETTLCYPWIVKMFPNAHYINWLRDPRDYGRHLSDNFDRWNIVFPRHIVNNYINTGISKSRIMAAFSCKYQFDIIENTPKPKRFIRVKYEDFCTDQKSQISRLEEFVGKSLKSVEVKTDSVQKWKNDAEYVEFPFLDNMIKKGGY